MDLSINNVNFSGKKDVIYGLTKAAETARRAEIDKAMSIWPGPMYYYIEQSKIDKVFTEVHMDMSVCDDEFIRTIKDFPEEKTQELRQLLRPERLSYAGININPLKIFKEALSKHTEKHQKVAETEHINKFIESITDNSIYNR